MTENTQKQAQGTSIKIDEDLKGFAFYGVEVKQNKDGTLAVDTPATVFPKLPEEAAEDDLDDGKNRLQLTVKEDGTGQVAINGETIADISADGQVTTYAAEGVGTQYEGAAPLKDLGEAKVSASFKGVAFNGAKLEQASDGTLGVWTNKPIKLKFADAAKANAAPGDNEMQLTLEQGGKGTVSINGKKVFEVETNGNVKAYHAKGAALLPRNPAA